MQRVILLYYMSTKNKILYLKKFLITWIRQSQSESDCVRETPSLTGTRRITTKPSLVYYTKKILETAYWSTAQIIRRHICYAILAATIVNTFLKSP